MSLEVQIDPSTGTATMTVSGKFTLDVATQAIQRLLDHTDFREGSDVLWDLRTAEIPDAAREDMLRLVGFVEERQPKRGADYRVAIVVSSDYHYGLARMYQAYADALPANIMVFRGLGEAAEWLGI